MGTNLARFFRQSLLSYKALYGFMDFKTFILIKIANPLCQLSFLVLLSRYIYGDEKMTSYIIGNSFLLCAYNALFGVGFVITQERRFGTLTLVIASTANKFFVFIGRAFMHIIDGCLSVLMGFIFSLLVFHVNVFTPDFGFLTIIILCSMFSAMGFGLLIGSAGYIVRDLNLIMNLCMFVLWLFSGAVVPLSHLPIWIQHISGFLPLTNGIVACQLLNSDGFSALVFSHIIKELLLGLGYFGLGYLLLHLFERISKVRASLDSY
ncbi:ABC transporter permease [Paenibacillus sp. 19GGS1-52]|uniref:ABC transporter permease n=1 Tax=Paenibacillus sp. 19GGS1-52 TaxID=2758563 RepID=UPI001EFAFAC6|nr:ABC transporter permease [Paenibacillus sp. 19GGS1-52]ULO05921.1 ABC transporter permease [Paenibacillus sp. 19GGS1-52]